jgi:hypothetical protein
MCLTGIVKPSQNLGFRRLAGVKDDGDGAVNTDVWCLSFWCLVSSV